MEGNKGVLKAGKWGRDFGGKKGDIFT